jgi:hypothetical protein
MRLLPLILLVMGFGFAAHAQTNTAPADATSAKATEPLSTTVADNTRYENNPDILNACTARVTAANDQADIIFIGDTLTDGWLGAGKATWDKSYAPLHALNFGVDGDKTQNVLWRLSNMSVQNMKPKVAVVLVGAENTMNTPHEIADGIKAVLANTQETFSGVKIILVSIPPSERGHDKMSQVNSLIKGDADGSSVYFLNLVPLMSEATTTDASGKANTTWKGIAADHLHLDANGYQIWADAMEPMLTKLMTGQ